jgi:hypothetical protein
MKTAESTLKEFPIASFDQFHRVEGFVLYAMKLYALNCAKQALEDAANNVRLCEKGEHDYDYDYPVISKQSILDTEIKTP